MYKLLHHISCLVHTEISGDVAVNKLVNPNIDLVADNFEASDSHGVDITVWTQCEDFSAMGYIIDQLDSLINERFPGGEAGSGGVCGY